MAIKITYSERAQADIREIIGFYLQYNDLDMTTRLVAALLAEIESLASEPMLGNKILGLEEQPQYRYWLIGKRRYFVYFERVSNLEFTTLRIYSSKRPQLQPDEII